MITSNLVQTKDFTCSPTCIYAGKAIYASNLTIYLLVSLADTLWKHLNPDKDRQIVGPFCFRYGTKMAIHQSSN